MSRTVGKVLRQGVQQLTRAASPEPQAAAEVLLSDLLNWPRYALFLEANHQLRPDQIDDYEVRLARRVEGEPVQYITGTQEFWSLPFRVTPHVLIPRPETELLVEYGVQAVQDWQHACPAQPAAILEVGVGSGCVAISLAHTLPESPVWGIDVSIAALQVARANAQNLGVYEQITWVCGDLTTPLQETASRFALCVSNLPYVTTDEWSALSREVKDHEPSLALVGGPDGLDIIRRLIGLCPRILTPGGTLLLEVGWQQASRVVELIQAEDGFDATGIYSDFAGIERVVWARACA